MIEGDFFALSGYDFLQGYRFGFVAASSDHHAEGAVADQIRARGAEASGEEAIDCRWGAAALDVTEDGDARFEAGVLLEQMRQAQGVSSVLPVQFGELRFGLGDRCRGLGPGFPGLGLFETSGVFAGKGA